MEIYRDMEIQDGYPTELYGYDLLEKPLIEQ